MDLTPDPSQSNKLTDWANEPSLLTLKEDFEMAKPSHDAHVRRVDHWNDLMQVKGAAKPPQVRGRSRVQPKLIRRQAEWRYSALSEPFLGSAKLYQVKPSTFEDADAAKQNEMLLNYQFRTKLNRVKFIDDYVRATVDEGSCVLRVGWQRHTVMVDTKVPVYTHREIASEEDAQAFQQALEMFQNDIRTFNESASPELKAAVDFYNESGQASVATQTGTKTEKVEKAIVNKPTVDVLNMKNVYFDPSCLGDIEKALFAVVSFETSRADLKKEPKRYKNLDKVNWSTSTPLTETDHARGEGENVNDTNFKDTLRKRVVAYEYWGYYDIYNDGCLHPIVCTWIGDTIIRMELNPFPDEKLPFIVVQYLPVKREMFGEPDAELLEDNQKIVGALTRGMIDLMGRSANGQQGFAKGMLDPVNRRRYDQGQDYEFNPNLTPSAGLIEHKYPEIPQSALIMVQSQNNEAEALTGVKSFSGGISGQAYGEVAAGIRGVLDAASKREMAILRRLAKGIVELGVKICAMNAIFLSEEETIRVTNEKFVKIKREDLKGDFDLEVDIATAEVDDQKSKDLGFILQTTGPNEDPEIRKIILSEICDLKRMPDLAHRIRTFKAPVDPAVEKMKELQLQKADLENKVLQSEIELNQAKAAEARAQKDKADLDYVEQETGTKHARDLEQTEGQSKGNIDLAITKAILHPKKPDEKEPNIEGAVGYKTIADHLDGHSSSDQLEMGAPAVDNTLQRDDLVNGGDPRYNIGSRFYDPSADPSSNPNLNI